MSVGWFCLRSQPKHEHIAAAHLSEQEAIEVFLPRVRFKRLTRQKATWVTEALFPGYLFARFDGENLLRKVHHTPGVQGIVHFGTEWPVIPEKAIEELRQVVGSAEPHLISPELTVGDAVQIAEGTFRGLPAIVSRIMSSQERVAVLMDFLGRKTPVELKQDLLIKKGSQRVTLFEELR